MANIENFVKTMSFSTSELSEKQQIAEPNWEDVLNCIREIDTGKVKIISLWSEQELYTNMTITAKPGNYHIGIFIDEYEEYLFEAFEKPNAKVDVGGNYWPNNQICTEIQDLISIAKFFFETGKPSTLFNWIYYIDEDE
ncbi:hypothetical protein DXX93_17195 [Thalassotalea euphylliae]|uniref:Uncharacterized protein n=1 Tax=Thalassotalea euphylliae TaxID=1655234 RepID=A0A3E0TU93_9GAMM|nr:hypothetical protein [Thalassotalea euphylliae]REL28128.1 hypothetical protein DXX93_17195 [Thalassotalea euphylliae]